MKSIGQEIRQLERFVARGQAEQALEGYERLQARLPRDPVIRSRVSFLRDSVHRHAPEWQVRTYVISPRAVAEAHVMAGRFADALEVLASLLELQPDDTGLARRVAMVRAMRDGRQDAGIETTASTALMSPEMLVEAQLAAGEVAAALRVLRSMAARRPDDARLHERMQALAEAWNASAHAPPQKTSGGPATQDSLADLPTLDGAEFDEIDVTELDSVDAPARHSPAGAKDSTEAELDTQVLEGLLADARAVIRDDDSGARSAPASRADPAELGDTLPGPERQKDARRHAPPAPRRVPTSQRPASAVAADGAESGGLLSPAPGPKVRFTRRQSSPERLQRGSAKDLRSGDPHADRERGLLGPPSGQVRLPRSGAFDIHELLTETGTNPSIAVDSVFSPSPSFSPPPQAAVSPKAIEVFANEPPPAEPLPAGSRPSDSQVVEPDLSSLATIPVEAMTPAHDAPLASPGDFEDESTIASDFGGDRLPHAPPNREHPAPSRSAEMSLGRDLEDDADEPTVLEIPPRAEVRPEPLAEHEQATVIAKAATPPRRRTRAMRRHKKNES